MAKQEFIAGGYFLNETLVIQYLIPGWGQANESVQNLSNSYTENVTGNDSYSVDNSIPEVYYELVTSADSYTYGFTFNTSYTETIAAADAIGSSGIPRDFIVPGGYEINEEAVRQYFIAGYGQVNATSPYYQISAIFNTSTSQAVTGNDSLTAAATYNTAYAETVASADNYTSGFTYNVSYVELVQAVMGYPPVVARQYFIPGEAQVNEVGQFQHVLPGFGQLCENCHLFYRQQFIAGGYQINETGTWQYFVPGYGQMNERSVNAFLPGYLFAYNLSYSEGLTGNDSLTSLATFNAPYTENVFAYDTPIQEQMASAMYAGQMYGNLVYGVSGNGIIVQGLPVSLIFGVSYTEIAIASDGQQRSEFIAGGYQIDEVAQIQYLVAGYGQLDSTSGVMPATASFTTAIAAGTATAGDSVTGIASFIAAFTETVASADNLTAGLAAYAAYTEMVTAFQNYPPFAKKRQEFIAGGYEVNETGSTQYLVAGQGQVNESSSPQLRSEFIAGGYQFNESGIAQFFIPGYGQVNDSSLNLSISAVQFFYNAFFAENITGSDGNTLTVNFMDVLNETVQAFDVPISRVMTTAMYAASAYGAIQYGLSGASIVPGNINVSVNFVTVTSEAVTGSDSWVDDFTYGVSFIENIVAAFTLAVFEWERNPNRIFKVDTVLTDFIANGTNVNSKFYKTPNELDFISIDYVNILDIDNIVSSAWTSSSTAMTVNTPASSFAGSVVTAWIGAGVTYGDYFASNSAATQGGRTFQESVEVLVQGHNYTGAGALIISQQSGADVDYSFDWTPRLTTDTIVTSTWRAEGNDNALTLSFTDGPLGGLPTATLVYISGGTIGQGYAVTNEITTTSGRTLEASFKVIIQQNVLQ